MDMTIEQMRAAIAEQEAAMMPPGFRKLKHAPEVQAYFCDGGWQIGPARDGWTATCIGPDVRSFHVSADGPSPADALAACKAELRRIAALMMERAAA